MFENTILPRLDFRQHQNQATLKPVLANNIIDIRSDKEEKGLRESLEKGIEGACHGEAAMPDLLLWDEKGLRYFEDVTYTPSYYLTDEEIGILEKQKYQIAQRIQPGSMLVELGSGNLRKIKILLEALDDLGHDVDYFALDVSLPELQRTLRMVPPGIFRRVRCFGLLGTYDDGCEWLRRPEIEHRPKTLISLGSTLGGLKRTDAAAFLSGCLSKTPLASRAYGDNPSFLIGLDGCKERERVLAAYNDKNGINRQFIKHGLERANEILGHNTFDLERWDVAGRWDQENGSHNQYYFSRTDVLLKGIAIPTGRKLLAVQSHKYDADDCDALCQKAGLEVIDAWASENQYNLLFLGSA